MRISSFKHKLGTLSKWHSNDSRINQPNYLFTLPSKFSYFPSSNGRDGEEYDKTKTDVD